jgi:hypothetical protein
MRLLQHCAYGCATLQILVFAPAAGHVCMLVAAQQIAVEEMPTTGDVPAV